MSQHLAFQIREAIGSDHPDRHAWSWDLGILKALEHRKVDPEVSAMQSMAT